MIRHNEKMPVIDATPLGYGSVTQVAKTLGVTANRINQLRKRRRIEGTKRHNHRYIVPWDTRSLSAKKEKPGPVTDYVKRWHERHKDSYSERA